MRFDDLAVGMVAEFTKTVTEADVIAFAGLSGDFNPVHVDAVAASRSRFGERIAHGLLSASFISTVIAMKLPGPGTIYLGQTLRFTRPVKLGDTITARAEVREIVAAKRRVILATTCTNQHGELVVDGEATVLVPAEESS
ncbi:MAG: MaoC family dehydratase [Gemmatimonadaceae bacterium]|jgi:3-hydroxybutyryl-CoA dehydratase|nr:MaoC family dehydratase [Gemmatimonadaceae bacterium]